VNIVRSGSRTEVRGQRSEVRGQRSEIRDQRSEAGSGLSSLITHNLSLTRTLNQAVKRNIERFPEDFLFQLSAREKSEVITNCDHLNQLKFAKSMPFAFTEHGAIMAATVLNSRQAVTMSVYVVRAFVQMRDELTANCEVLKRIADIDRTLLQHDAGLRDIYRKLLPLLQPAPLPPKRRIGFGGDENR
jgi:hypothetical protein